MEKEVQASHRRSLIGFDWNVKNDALMTIRVTKVIRGPTWDLLWPPKSRGESSSSLSPSFSNSGAGAGGDAAGAGAGGDAAGAGAAGGGGAACCCWTPVPKT